MTGEGGCPRLKCWRLLFYFLLCFSAHPKNPKSKHLRGNKSAGICHSLPKTASEFPTRALATRVLGGWQTATMWQRGAIAAGIWRKRRNGAATRGVPTTMAVKKESIYVSSNFTGFLQTSQCGCLAFGPEISPSTLCRLLHTSRQALETVCQACNSSSWKG